jgi:hypothetical protein
VGQGLVDYDPVLGANGAVGLNGSFVFVVTTGVAKVEYREALKPEFMTEFQ